uniref:(northern house mosquito) hypothetical protein n=1 Tax=Culex pipiens TaxID=7175 RepID=A0A8D8GCH3_CULPI
MHNNNGDNNRKTRWKTKLETEGFGKRGRDRWGSLPKGHINSETHTGSYCSKVTTKCLRFFVYSSAPRTCFVLFISYCCLIMSAAISLKISSRLLLSASGNCFAPIFMFFYNSIFLSTLRH